MERSAVCSGNAPTKPCSESRLMKRRYERGSSMA